MRAISVDWPRAARIHAGTMSRPLGRAFMASLGAASFAIAQGCDPAEDPGVWDPGPTFLIVAPAVEQPAAPEDGTAIYIQARGGSFVSIVTTGGKHRYTELGQDAKSSCAQLPGSEPLYLIVKPDNEECVVETRLYADCDTLGDGAIGLGICGSHTAFIASDLMTVLSRAKKSDAGGAADVNHDVGVGHDADAARKLDAASDVEAAVDANADGADAVTEGP
jgi:hypothetical protein